MYDILSILALVFSVGGNILINFRKVSGYYCWIASNVLWVWIALISPQINVPQILMFVIYTVLNIIGVFQWKQHFTASIGGEEHLSEKIQPL